ncbi:hypothetical protein [Streptacidiphilus sp. EB129]|uniref:hypothetical protein n=1 Tax=Streptacidiphilus sp. EB129 TaxID=3156262 RepID=UPI0035138096
MVAQAARMLRACRIGVDLELGGPRERAAVRTVVWMQQIVSGSPEDAAVQALEELQACGELPPVFLVTDPDGTESLVDTAPGPDTDPGPGAAAAGPVPGA